MRSIFITGAAAGIGAATARLFVDKGWRVGLCDIAPVQPFSNQVQAFQADVRDLGQLRAALADFAGEGGLDVMVNNAGVVRYGRFEEIDPAAASAMVDVNLKGVINGAYAALPHLRRKRGSTLVNVASAGAIYGGPNLAVYTATKFGVRGLSEALDAEWAPHGVGVRCIMPWFTESAMIRQAGEGPGVKSLVEDMGKHGVDPPEVPARAIWDAVHGDRLHHPIGRAKAVYHMVRLFPGFMRRTSRKQVLAAAGPDA